MLRRDRWSTLAIALTLALGIGAATATFAVFNTLIFRPTPGVHSESDILTVLFQPPSRTATAYGSREALDPLRQAATGLERAAITAIIVPMLEGAAVDTAVWAERLAAGVPEIE